MSLAVKLIAETKFEVPGPPRPKLRPRSTGQIRRIGGKIKAIVTNVANPKNLEQYRKIEKHFRQHMMSLPADDPFARAIAAKPWDQPFRIDFRFMMPHTKESLKKGLRVHSKKPDRDNLEKLPLDVMSKIVYSDDGRNAMGFSIKLYSHRPRTIIRIRLYEYESKIRKRNKGSRSRVGKGPTKATARS